MLCHQFEDLITDYLDQTLPRATHRVVAAHVLQCPICHALLNEVKTSISLCHNAFVPKPALDLEARVLQMTMPGTAMSCAEFENLLTDYLDGFLPAALFHRWERHSSLCAHCTDLPGEVVRSIGACYTYKADELSLPEGLHERILQTTLGTTNVAKIKMSFAEQCKQKLENLLKPIFSPILTAQFASVAMMLLMAFMLFSDTASADNSIGGIYQKGLQLAAQTYEQSSEAVENGLNESLNFKNSESPADAGKNGERK